MPATVVEQQQPVASGQNSSILTYDPAAQIDDLFHGVLVEPTVDAAANPTAAQPAAPASETAAARAQRAAVQTTPAASNFDQPSANTGTTASPNSASTEVNPVTQQLTETLRAANGPPQASIDGQGFNSLGISNVNTQTNSLHTGGNGSSSSVQFSSGHSADGTTTPPPVDLQFEINQELQSFFTSGSSTPTIPAGGQRSFTETGDFMVGTRLELHGVTLNFTNLAYANGSWSGSVEVSSASATLIVSSTQTVEIAKGGTTNPAMQNLAVDQTFTLNGATFTFTDATQFTLGGVADPTQIGWPSWLVVQTTALGISWQHLQTDPANARMTFSADVMGFKIPSFGDPGVTQGIINTLATFQGTVTGATVDLNLLQQGQFAVTGIQGVSAEVGLNIPLLGSVEGGLVLGVAPVDASGNVIPVTNAFTPVDHRVFYAAILVQATAGDKLLGLSTSGSVGFAFRIGFSSLGPLQLYLQIFAPVVLEPVSGLTISNFRGGVSFNDPLPTVTDPRLLRGPAFAPVDTLSIQDWTHQLQQAVANQAQAASPNQTWGAFANLLQGNEALRIEGGATLYSQKIPQAVLSADADFIFSTDGKFEVVASLNVLTVLKFTARLYGDLSGIANGTASILLLADLPDLPGGLPPLLSLSGGVLFKPTASNGRPVSDANPADNFTLELVGGIDINVPAVAPISLTGTVDFIFSSHGASVTVHSHVVIPGVGSFPMVSGAFTVDGMDTSTPDIWGWAALGGNLTFFQDLGVTISGTVLFRINTSSTDHQVTITNAGNTTQTLDLPTQSASFFLSGSLLFDSGGQQWFSLGGTFEMQISSQGLDVVVTNASLTIGPPSQSFLQFQGSAFLAITNSGVAASLYMTLATNFPSSFGVNLAATFVFYLNTTSQDVSLTVPSTASGANADTTVTVPRGPPPAGTAVGATTWVVPNGTAGKPYLLIQATGSLTVLSNFALQGKFDLLVSPTVLAISAHATLDLKAGSTTILSLAVAGALSIDSSGLVADFALSVSSGVPASLGFNLTGATFRLDLNTTNAPATVDGVSLPAGPYARVHATGPLSIGDISLNGTYDLTADSQGLDVAVNAPMGLKAGPITVLSFSVVGELTVDSSGIAGVISLTNPSTVLAALGFNFSPDTSFRLEINTTNQPLTLAGVSMPAGPHILVHANGALGVGGLDLAGTFDFSFSAGALHLAATAVMNLAAGGTTLFAFNVSGSLTVSASGIVGVYTLSVSSGVPSGLGFSISGQFQLEINTTSSPAQVNRPGGDSTVLTAGTVRVFANGTFTVAGVINIGGKFELTLASTQVGIHFDASLSLFNTPALYLEGDATIYSNGIALSLYLSPNRSGDGTSGVQSQVIYGPLTFNGVFQLQIDTRTGTYLISVTSLNINAFGFNLTGSVTIGISNGQFSINIPSNNPLTLGFFGLVTLQVSGFINSNGTFSLTAGAGITIGNPSYFGISGSISVTFSNSGFAGSVSGTVTAFNTTLAGAFGTIAINGSQVSVSITLSVLIIPAVNIDTPDIHVPGVDTPEVRVCAPWWLGGGCATIVPAIHIPGYTIPGVHIHTSAVYASETATFVLGSTTAAPGPPPPPPPPALATLLGDRTLQLNLGVDVGNRGANYPAQPSEQYTITHVGGSAGAENVIVSALNFQKEYDNISGIIVHNTGTGNDFIQINDNVLSPVNVTLGSGSNQITTGGGFATLTGGTGNNVITAGSAGGTLTGGTGQSTAHDPNHVLTVLEPGFLNYALSNTTLTYDGNQLNLDGVTHVTLVGGGSSDSFNLTNWTGSASVHGQGASSQISVANDVNYNLANGLLTESNGASVSLANIADAQLVGGATDNTFDVSGWTGTASLFGGPGTNTLVSSNNADFTLGDSQMVRSTGGTFNLTSIQVAQLSGGAGGSHFDVSDWTGTGSLTGHGGTNTVLAANDTNFALTDSSLDRDGFGSLTLSNVQAAVLTGGSSSDSFTVSNWTGNAALNGATNLYTVNLLGSGSGTVTITDGLANGRAIVNAPAADSSVTVTGGRVTRGSETVNYTGLSSLAVNGGIGNDTFAITGINPATNTTVDGGQGANAVGVDLAQDFAGTLTLVKFQTATVQVGGNFDGSLTAKAPGSLQQVTIGSSMTGGTLSAANIGTMTVGQGVGGNLAGALLVSQNLSSLSVGGTVNGQVSAASIGTLTTGLDLSGHLQVTGDIQHLNIGRSVTGSGVVTIGGDLVNSVIGQDVAGKVNVGGNIGNLTVGGSVSGQITAGTVTSIAVTQNVSGAIQVTGALDSLTIDGSLAGSGLVTIGGNLASAAVGGSLAGTLHAGTAIGTLNDGGSIAGSVSAGTSVNALTVNGNVSGQVTVGTDLTNAYVGQDVSLPGRITVSGTIGSLTINGFLLGMVTASNNLNKLQENRDISGTVNVGLVLDNLTVVGAIKGGVTVGGNLNQLKISGDLAGTVSVGNNLVAGTLTGNLIGALNVTNTLQQLSVGGSETNLGRIQAKTINNLAVAGDVAGSVKATGGNFIVTMSVGGSVTVSGLISSSGTIGSLAVTRDLAGHVTTTGTITTLLVGASPVLGSITGRVSVGGDLITLTVTGDVAGVVSVNGNLSTTSGSATTIGGSVGGTITVGVNSSTLGVGHNVSGTIQITGNLGTATVGGSISGTVTVGGSVTTLTAGQDISGSVTVTGALNTLTVTGSETSNGVVSVGANLNTLTVHGSVAGKITVGANLMTTQIDGDVSGSLLVTTLIDQMAAGGNVSGTIQATTINHLTIGGDVSGTVKATGTDTIGTMIVHGSETSTGVITSAGTIHYLEIDGNLAGLVHTATNLVTLLVGTSSFAGSITTTGQVTVGGDLTTLTVTGDVAGTVTVGGSVTTLTAGHDISGSVTVTGALNTLTVTGSETSTGLVSTGANLNTLTVHGSVAGKITVGANLMTTQIDGDVSGSLLVTTLIDQMMVGGNVSGTIQATTINHLTIGGDVSGTVKATGADTIGTMVVHGSETSTGMITSAGTINYLEIDDNLAGQVHAATNLGTLLVGTSSFAGSITNTGQVTVGGDLTTLTVTGDVAGTVTVTGNVVLATIDGSVSGTITVGVNSTSLSVGHDVSGTVQITSNLGTGTIGGSISGTVTVGGSVTTLTVGQDISGRVEVTGSLVTATISGSVSGTVSVVADLTTLTVSGDVTGAITVTGNLSVATGSATTIGGSVSGTVTVQGNAGAISVGQNVSGTIGVHGMLDQLTISGSVTRIGIVIGTVNVDQNLNTLTVHGSVAGRVTVHANLLITQIDHDVSGTIAVTLVINQMTVGGNVSGTIQATTINQLTIGGDVSGSVSATGADTIGTMIVHGSETSGGVITSAGTINYLEIDGNLAGQVHATSNLVTLLVGTSTFAGSIATTGQVTVGGDLTTLTVTGDVAGTVTVTGKLVTATIDGSLASKGRVSVGLDLNTLMIGGDLAGQLQVGRNLGSETVGGSISGAMTVNGDLTTLTVGHDVSGTVQVTGNVTTATIGGSVTSQGLFSVGGNLNTMTVGANVSGTIQVIGTITNLTITGSVTDAGQVLAGNLVTMEVFGDMAGALTVVGKLTTLIVHGATSGTISAGDIDTIAVYLAHGPIVARITEGGITRRIEAALPGNPYPNPKDANTPASLMFPGKVTFQYFYDSRDSAGITDPQLAIRVNNPSPGTLRFDLSLVTYSDSAKFELARLDAAGGTQGSGIRNLVVEGDLLTAVTAPMSAFFGYAAGTPGGVRLPADAITGVAIRDFAPLADIQVTSLGGIAFGATVDENGKPVNWTNSNGNDAQDLLTAGVLTMQANDTFRVAFGDNHPVAFFMATEANNHSLDNQNVILTDQAPNDARGAVTALITVVVPVDAKGHPQDSTIQSIALRGDGGAIQTKQAITQSITSSGPLGDLYLSAPQGITANITAPSIFGNIDASSGPISGTIQTTSLRLDAISGLTSSVAADWGRTYMVTTKNGPAPAVTYVHSGGGGLSGRLISRANLISQIISDGGISGVVAVQGNLGTTVGTTRLGGLLSNGTTSGQVVVLGSVLGEVTLHGGLKSGRVAIGGSVLSNLSIDGGVDVGSAIVCRGSIGSATAGTTFTLDSLKGILGVEGNVNFAKSPNTSSALFYRTNLGMGNTNANALDAIFTNGGHTLLFDLTNPQDLQGLTLILKDLVALRVSSGVLTGTTP